MSSLINLPRETVLEIALSLPNPQDVKHFSSTCRGLRETLGRTNQLLWWQIWRKMYWMPATYSAGNFSKSIDYWQRVTEILIPDPKKPAACFKCFIQASFNPVHTVYYEDNFYRALCYNCLNEDFWIIDLLPMNYIGLDPPSEMHATVVTPASPSQIYMNLFWLGRIRDAKYRNKWILRKEARSLAKSILPTEKKRSDYRIFMSRWKYTWEEVCMQFVVRLRTKEAKGTDREYLYTIDFHLGVGEIVFGMIEDLVNIYTEKYKALHVIRSPQEFLENLTSDALAEVSLGGAYEDRLVPLRMGPRVDGLVTGDICFRLTNFATNEHQACIVESRGPSDLSNVCQNILALHFGNPSGLEHKLGTKIWSHQDNRVLRSWFDNLFASKYRRNANFKKLRQTGKSCLFKCPFCSISNAPGTDLPAPGSLVERQLFVEHIFEEHHEKFRDSWNNQEHGAPPEAYIVCDSGELEKLDYSMSTWIDDPISDLEQDS